MTLEQIGDEGTPINPSPEAASPPPEVRETGQIARAAGVLAAGNIISRVLGLARETAKSHYFGAGAVVDAYGVATLIPTMLYDLIVGGMVNGALVPVFSEYAERDREELWRLVSALLNMAVVLLAVVVLLAELFAPQIAAFELPGHSAEIQALGAQLLRITLPAVMFLSLSGVLSGLLYALKRFSLPSFTAAVFNATIVVAAVALHKQLGIRAMALGLLVGAAFQVVLQLPGLRDTTIRLGLRFWHPGLKKVGLLYVPTLIPLLFDVGVSRPISYQLAARAGEGGISYLTYATQLVQMPQGLVAAAISMAVLPTLSAYAARENDGAENRAAFEQTFARGLRLVITLIVPAAVGLFLLSQPVIALLYEHGDYNATDTFMTMWALRYYLLGLPFAAVDLLLVYTFYARQDTVTPSIIGVGTLVVYLALAASLLPTLGLFSLMIADSVKHVLHTFFSALILSRRLDGLGKNGVGRTLLLVPVAAAAMGLAVYGSLLGVQALLPAGGLSELLSVLVPAGIGVAVYAVLVTVFGVEEIRMLWLAVKRRFTGR